jgi:hypothetical protein
MIRADCLLWGMTGAWLGQYCFHVRYCFLWGIIGADCLLWGMTGAGFGQYCLLWGSTAFCEAWLWQIASDEGMIGYDWGSYFGKGIPVPCGLRDILGAIPIPMRWCCHLSWRLDSELHLAAAFNLWQKVRLILAIYLCTTPAPEPVPGAWAVWLLM